MRFGFGRNWERFIERNFNEQRVEESRRHLLDFLGMESLEGLSFLDIGCGSGLHSLAAFKSGAAKIRGFDYDPFSVKTTMKLREMCGGPGMWTVGEGSVLDDAFMESLEPADIVYSWGVLHHTGDMWKAMDNAAGRLKDGKSLLYIALYDYDIQVNPTPEFWLDLKQGYNRGGALRRRYLELWYIMRFGLSWNLFNLPSFIRKLKSRGRGMEYYTDVVDWLGGWPMEFAKRADVDAWAKRHSLEMLSSKHGEANSEYLFRKKAEQGL